MEQQIIYRKYAFARFPICSATKDQILLSTQIYRGNHRYNIHKQINTNMKSTRIQWKNNSYIWDTYEKCPR